MAPETNIDEVNEDNSINNQHNSLEDYERSGDGRAPFILNYSEVKLLGIAGVGFFLDGEWLVSAE